MSDQGRRSFWRRLLVLGGKALLFTAALASPLSLVAQHEASPSPTDSSGAIPILTTRDLNLRYRLSERGAAAPVAYVLHVTRDEGQTWARVEGKLEGPAIRYHASEDGRYGFSVTIVDASGATGPTPTAGQKPERVVVIDTHGPQLRILQPSRRQSVAPDDRVEIEWQATDAHLGAAAVEVSAAIDDGPWEVIVREGPPHSLKRWRAPLLPGEVKLRFRARDAVGNITETETPVVYDIARTEPGLSRAVSVPERIRSRRVPIYYRIERERGAEPLDPSQLRAIQVWYRIASHEWSRGTIDEDRRSPLIFNALQDGWVEILVTAIDREGRWLPAEAAPGPDGRPDASLPAHARFLVDTTEPRVRIVAPQEGSWVQASAPLEIQYQVEEENPATAAAVTLYTSLDGGANWTEIAKGLEPVPVGGGRLFQGDFRFTLPAVDSERFLVKAVAKDAAGNEGETSTEPARAITIRNPTQDPRQRAEDHYRRGLAQARSDDAVVRLQSLDSFRRALVYNPQHFGAHYDLARALEATQSLQPDVPADAIVRDALEHLRQAQLLKPEDPRVAFQLVESLLKQAELKSGTAAASPAAEPLIREAERIFRQTSLERLAELYSEDIDEYKRLRALSRQWKEKHFNRLAQ